MATDWARWCTLVSALSILACGGSSGSTIDAGGTDDIDGAPADASCAAALQCGDNCCAVGQTCTGGLCLGAAACTSNDDCDNDAFCDLALGQCVPYDTGGFDAECTQISVLGVFAPAVQCDWAGPPVGDSHPDHVNVLSTPAVIDFDFDSDPATLAPSIVFVSYNGDDGGDDACVGNATFFGVIRVIDGRDCTQQYSISSPSVVASGPVAVADLDRAPDGRPEIVAHRIGGGLVAFRYDSGTDAFVQYWVTTSTLGAGICNWAGPSVHDLNDDGNPEVLMGASVFNGQTGVAIDASRGLRYVTQGQIPVVADVDGDNRPDLLTGDAVFEWDPTAAAGVGAWVVVGSSLGSAGLVAVADFGTYGADPLDDDRSTLDGIPEVAVVSSGTARVQTLDGRDILGPTTLLFFPPAANPGTGGPPTVADFDGDGRVEMAVAGRGGYNVFDPDCTGTPDPATCNTARTDGILWAAPTQDISSSVTGSAVFDFEGNGTAEVVYADECFSRVYSGSDGEIEYSQFRTSCTWYENPIVADVDGDFNSEIVIPSNTNCSGITCPTLDPQFDGLRCEDSSDCPGATTCTAGHCRCAGDIDCGGNGYVCRDPIAGPSPDGQVCRAGHPGTKVHGVRVVRDALDRWVNSRPLWNQHAYAVTHIDDAGHIPTTSTWAENWLTPGLNNFRQAIAGDPDSSVGPDATSRGQNFACTSEGADLHVSICNRGTEPLGAGVPVTFYQGGAPPAGMPVCTSATTAILQPGECTDLTCPWSMPPEVGVDLIAIADDDGTGTSANTECHEGNNQTVLSGVGCTIVE